MEWRKDYDEIKNTFEKFVKAWESQHEEGFDDCMIMDSYTEFSMFGALYSRELLKVRLHEMTRKPTYSRFEIEGYCCLIEGDRAQQCASMLGLFTDDSQEVYTHLGFTGMFANTWEKRPEGWRMVSVKFDWMTDDSNVGSRDASGAYVRNAGDGSLSFVENWRPIKDYTGLPGLPAICAETDAPWYAIKNRENIGTDEEQIAELFARYSFAIDNSCQALLPDLFTDDCVISMAQLGEMSAFTFIKTNKENHKTSIRSHHTGHIVKLDIKGDKAKGIIHRKAPDELYPYQLTKETEKANIVAARYEMTFRKEDGQWRISRMCYMPGSFIVGYYD